MDKTAIRNFAIEARKILMKSAITEAGFYGITKDGCKDPVQKGNDFEVYETVAGTENRIFGDDIKRRANLVQAIKTLGFEQVIEETAYTWFNRIIAIRFMEVNNYLPTRVRVLSSETGSGTPDIITQADTVELNLTSDELEKIQTAKRENRYDDAFRMLFIKQCNELNAILPGLFEKTDDYMELLLKITYTGDGIIRMLVDSIPEDNFNVETEGQVEIIGWMYQYYNTELKDDTFAKLKKNVKITKERIPAATQLFTPDWIVRYMVENSLGRVWIEHLRAVNPSVDEKAKAEEFGWKYYLPEAEQEDEVQAQLVEIRKSYKDLTPQDITCIDPCMGSGHILVYMFDVLMDIYRSEGFSEREAVFDILEKNIRGLDIDRRAYQLSYFALMMKARGYNRIFFRGHEDIDGNRVQAVPRVYAIEESNSIDREQLKYFGAGLDEISKNNAINQMNGLLDSLNDAKEYGSILSVENYDWNLLRSFLEKMVDETQGSLFGFMAFQSKDSLEKLIDIGETLADKYDAVVTNPPYMGASGMAAKMSEYVKKHYSKSKGDLFAVFIEVAHRLTKKNGYQAMITQHQWMFLAGYAELRQSVNTLSMVSLAHLGIGTFEELNSKVVQSVAFVIRNLVCPEYTGAYNRLFEKHGVQENNEEKAKWLITGKHLFKMNQSKFSVIDGSPIAYWISDHVVDTFNSKRVRDYADARQGLITGDNDTYMRFWYEPAISNVCFDCEDVSITENNGIRWYPYAKGGGFRRWYGFNEYVVDWYQNGAPLKNFKDDKGKLRSRPQNIDTYFKTGLTWSALTTYKLSLRTMDSSIYGGGGAAMFVKEGCEEYLLGFMNSCVAQFYLNILNPTINFLINDILALPVIIDKKEEIEKIVEDNVRISKEDYDSFETSVNFKGNPIVKEALREKCSLRDAYDIWKNICNERIHQLRNNEERMNELFIEIYGLNNELSPQIEDKEIVLHRPELRTDIENLLSYIVGCIFGRYSLDKDGLVFAGEHWDYDAYSIFKPDVDGIIPICDEGYFEDDIIKRISDYLAIVFGKDNINDDLKFISLALSGNKSESIDVIREYFMKEFFAFHAKQYQKRPIYWLWDAGSNDGFKCLTYIHRYSKDTVGLIRSDYITKVQASIENALSNAEYTINTTASAVDRAQATKKRDKCIKQLADIRAYYPALSHIALQRIELDVDAGVKTNYEKFQNIEVSAEGEKKQKVDLLAKI